MSSPIILTSELSHQYGEFTALKSVSLSINSGTIYALLGPNGAGKTTMLSILSTLLKPTSGTAAICGFDCVTQAQEVRKRIAVAFQEIVLDKYLTGQEVLDYHGQLYGLSRPERTQRVDELLTLVELNEAAAKPVQSYSGGMKRRLELARGLMTDPQVLFLDEPTQGLDPQNREKVWSYLQKLQKDRNLTILLTTHYMEEAETLADRVGIIDHGSMVTEGPVPQLVAEMGADVIRLTLPSVEHSTVSALKQLPFAQWVNQTDEVIQVGVDSSNQRLAEVVSTAQSSGATILNISISSPGLADVFLLHTGRALRDQV